MFLKMTCFTIKQQLPYPPYPTLPHPHLIFISFEFHTDFVSISMNDVNASIFIKGISIIFGVKSVNKSKNVIYFS